MFGLGSHEIIIGVSGARLGSATHSFRSRSHLTFGLPASRLYLCGKLTCSCLLTTSPPHGILEREDLKKHKAELLHFTAEKPRQSQEVKTCAQGRTVNQELCQEPKRGRQTLSRAQFHLISHWPLSQALQRGPRVRREFGGGNFEF